MSFADFTSYNTPELGPTMDDGCGKEQVSALPLEMARGSYICLFLLNPRTRHPSPQELRLLFSQCPGILLLPAQPRRRVTPLHSPCGQPGLEAFARAACSLQHDAHASVCLAHAVSSALSHPAAGHEL